MPTNEQLKQIIEAARRKMSSDEVDHVKIITTGEKQDEDYAYE